MRCHYHLILKLKPIYHLPSKNTSRLAIKYLFWPKKKDVHRVRRKKRFGCCILQLIRLCLVYDYIDKYV